MLPDQGHLFDVIITTRIFKERILDHFFDVKITIKTFNGYLIKNFIVFCPVLSTIGSAHMVSSRLEQL